MICSSSSSRLTSAVTDYRRELDLQAGVARVKFKQGMVGYRREYFVSYPDQVLVGRWYSTAVQKIRVRYAVPDNRSVQTQVEVGKTGARIAVSGALKSNGLKYAAELLVIPDCGTVTADGESLRFEGDCAVTIILAARTNYSMRYPDYRDARVDPAARGARRCQRRGEATVCRLDGAPRARTIARCFRA